MKGEEELKSLEPLPPEIGWMDADHTFCQFFAQLGWDGCSFVFLVDRYTWDRFRDQTPEIRIELDTDETLSALRSGDPIQRSDDLRRLARRALARLDRTNRESTSVEEWAERLAEDVEGLSDFSRHKHDMDKETGLFRLYPDSLISEKTEGKVYRIVLEAKESR